MHSMQMIVLEIPWSGSLYEPSSDILFEKISHLMEQAQKGQTIVLKAVADCHDYSTSWLHYVRSEATWLDLYSRLNRWHKLLFQISASSSNWFFVATGDVVGSWWELALACKGRVATNPYAKVGFPEAYIDMIPPIGVLALKKFRIYQQSTWIRKEVILRARDAYRDGLIDLCFIDEEWSAESGLKRLQPWFDGFLDSLNPLMSKPIQYIQHIPSDIALDDQRENAQTRRKWLKNARISEIERLFRIKDLKEKAHSLAELRAAAASRFLMIDYRSWLARRVVRYRLGTHESWWRLSSVWVVIDVSQGLPPQEIVTRLLMRRKKLVFFCADQYVLSKALESVKSGFDRTTIEGQFCFDIWDKAVFWTVAEKCYDHTAIILKFLSDDRMIVRRGEVENTFYRISGNFHSASVGWCEEIMSQDNQEADSDELDEISEVMTLMSNGVVRSTRRWVSEVGVTSAEVPISVAIRFVLLEYLLRLAYGTRRVESFRDLLKLLETSGWGYASDILQWESLQRHYLQLEGALYLVDRFFPSNGHIHRLGGDLLSKLQIPKSSDTRASRIRSGPALSRLIAVLAYRVSRTMVRDGLIASFDEADLLISLAWGYPGGLLLPQDFERESSQNRLLYWESQVSFLQQESVSNV